jgi:hypothetical protein
VVVTSEKVTVTGAVAVTAQTSIDASAGKVIFGNDTNSVTIEKGTLTSNTTSNLVAAGSGGAVTLTYADAAASIALADGGTLTIAGTGSVTLAGALKIEGDGTTLSSTGQSFITVVNGKANLVTAATADGNGVLIGTAANGVSLLTNSAAAMTYSFTKSTGNAPVSISGEYITVPADATTSGAIFEATDTDKAKIVLGSTSGGFKIGKGAHGGKFSIVSSGSGGSTIGPFVKTGHADGNLPASLGLAGSDAATSGAKIDLGTFNQSTGFASTAATSTVTAYGTTGTGEATINSSVVLDSTT